MLQGDMEDEDGAEGTQMSFGTLKSSFSDTSTKGRPSGWAGPRGHVTTIHQVPSSLSSYLL